MGANPIGQVLKLLQEMHDTVVNDGEVEQKQFEEFAEWCEDEAKEKHHEIKTGNQKSEDLKATIEKAAADIEVYTSKIGELSESISANEADSKAGQEIRAKEHKTFVSAEKELVQTVDTLRRAQQVLKKALGGGASFAQLPQQYRDLTDSLQVIVDASIFNTQDKSRLQAFLQANEEGVNGPEQKAYESKSSGIIDTLADMQEKAEDLLEETRKSEVNARHASEKLIQSLTNEHKIQTDALTNTKKQLAQTSEVKATSEGDLSAAQKELSEDNTYLKDLSQDCQTRAVDMEVSTKSRAEELKALEEATKIIKEATGAASSRQYDFLQIKSTSKSRNALFDKIFVSIRNLGKKENASSLVQLAGQIRATASMNSVPFAKVKGMIQDMIKRLVEEAQQEASQKAFCDKETSENEAKRDKLTAEEQKLSTRIEKATASIAKLKEEIAELNTSLAHTAKSQKEMDQMRKQEHEEFLKAKSDFEQGLHGARRALQVLRDYYEKGASLVQISAAHAPGDMGGSIISILEVAESDFARSLAEAQATEDDSVDAYKKTTNENKVSTATKKASVEGKTQESARLEQAITDSTSDRNGVQEELTAVLEYLEKLKPQCVTQPDSYEERKARREREMEGLKSALEVLESETAFAQVGASGFLRRQTTIQ